MAEKENAAAVKTWHVYMVRCADNSLYTGVALCPITRCYEHNGDTQKGARYTRSRRPVLLVYTETCENKKQAYQREYALKRLPKSQKEALIALQEGVLSIST